MPWRQRQVRQCLNEVPCARHQPAGLPGCACGLYHHFNLFSPPQLWQLHLATSKPMTKNAIERYFRDGGLKNNTAAPPRTTPGNPAVPAPVPAPVQVSIPSAEPTPVPLLAPLLIPLPIPFPAPLPGHIPVPTLVPASGPSQPMALPPHLPQRPSLIERLKSICYTSEPNQHILKAKRQSTLADVGSTVVPWRVQYRQANCKN